ncbi:MAG: hypothetical protein KF762_11120 [Acidobacteria bacterium]|nr:hypothetical protein [Acidobacteriota bacterium]
MRKYLFPAILLITITTISQPRPPAATLPPIDPGVPLELAKWRAERYLDVRYKLNLTLEKMSPVLKGTMEIRLVVRDAVTTGRGDAGIAGQPTTGTQASPPASAQGAEIPPIILDWRKIRGHEEKSTISNVTINGRKVQSASFSSSIREEPLAAGGVRDESRTLNFAEHNEHLIFCEGVVPGENVITLDFTSPILTSGSAITRYVDKEDGSEYIYSLFVPSDASTAFPVFDQPDIKARFSLKLQYPSGWSPIGNSPIAKHFKGWCDVAKPCFDGVEFSETAPISTYVFAFAAGPFERVSSSSVSSPHVSKGSVKDSRSSSSQDPSLTVGLPTPLAQRNVKAELEDAYKKWLANDCCGIMTTDEAKAFREQNAEPIQTDIYVRKSQAEKFKLHAAEVFRLNRESIKYFEEYFDYKFPFPKYDLVLIPEFPFGGMEHEGATFLRESAIIFPQEPTKNDHISRALLIFHEASHQWFGDTVTMRWFDDLWLKEGFATFTAYKAMERIMPEMMAWKVFYERVKQAAYQTDSTKGTTPIYQEIPNLSAAKSAYGNIVYNKAPAFLRQAEFYLGEDKFQAAVRGFLKKHEFGNAGWEDLVSELERTSKRDLKPWARTWVTKPGLPIVRPLIEESKGAIAIGAEQKSLAGAPGDWRMKTQLFLLDNTGSKWTNLLVFEDPADIAGGSVHANTAAAIRRSFAFTNHQDYGYGIFLLDNKSREYVLKNIQNEKDAFLRSMMWGALWDSVREGELDPREFVDLVVRVLQKPAREQGRNSLAERNALTDVRASAIEDESTTALLLSRVGTAMNYYIADRVGGPRASKGSRDNPAPSLTVGPPTPSDLGTRVEEMLIELMQNAETLGQRITYYRAFLNVASSENARKVLKELITAETQRRGDGTGGNPSGSEGVPSPPNKNTLPTGRVSAADADKNRIAIPLKTKDKFDIVTRLLILGDPEAEKLLAELEKTETSDDAKRYAYAARAGIATAENKAKYWKDFTENKEISESWIEAAFGPWNSIRHSELTLPYLERALKELPNHKRNRKIFFVNGWLGAFIGGQRSEEALNIVNKFLADNPTLDRDLRLKILENADLIERAVKIRSNFAR